MWSVSVNSEVLDDCGRAGTSQFYDVVRDTTVSVDSEVSDNCGGAGTSQFQDVVRDTMYHGKCRQ